MADIRVVKGWHISEIEDVATKLNLIVISYRDNTKTPDLMTSEDGCNYINDRLRLINNHYSTNLSWTLYPTGYILQCDCLFQQTIGDPDDQPIETFILDMERGTTAIQKLVKDFNIAPPKMFLIKDASDLYYDYGFEGDSDLSDDAEDTTKEIKVD